MSARSLSIQSNGTGESIGGYSEDSKTELIQPASLCFQEASYAQSSASNFADYRNVHSQQFHHSLPTKDVSLGSATESSYFPSNHSHAGTQSLGAMFYPNIGSKNQGPVRQNRTSSWPWLEEAPEADSQHSAFLSSSPLSFTTSSSGYSTESSPPSPNQLGSFSEPYTERNIATPPPFHGQTDPHSEHQIDSPSSVGRSPSPDEKQEPYANIIYRALMAAPGRKMVLGDIYEYFRQNLPLRASKDDGWKNSIRHNLSMNGDFIKEPLPGDLTGRRNIWALSEHAQEHGISSTTKYRKYGTKHARRGQQVRRKSPRASRRKIKKEHSEDSEFEFTPTHSPPRTLAASENPHHSDIPMIPVEPSYHGSFSAGFDYSDVSSDDFAGYQSRSELMPPHMGIAPPSAVPFDSPSSSSDWLGYKNGSHYHHSTTEPFAFSQESVWGRPHASESWHASPYIYDSFTEQYNLVANTQGAETYEGKME